MEQMVYPNPHLLTAIGIADAYLYPIVGLRRSERAQLFIEMYRCTRYMVHPTIQEDPGIFTCATELACANGRFLQHGDLEHLERFELVDYWIEEMAHGRDHERNYDKTLKKALSRGKGPHDALAYLAEHPRIADSSAVVSALVWGVLSDPAEVKRCAEFQASITHDREGVFAATVVALLSHFAMWTDKSWAEFPEFCTQHQQNFPEFDYVFETPWEKGEGPKNHSIISVLHSALYCLKTHETLRSMLEWIVKTRGVRVAVAPIVFGVASARLPIGTLPTFMKQNLERTDMLTRLGTRLMDKYYRF